MKSFCLVVNSNTKTPVHINHDQDPNFDLILFNYSNESPDNLRQHWENAGFSVLDIITQKTECKGQIMHALADYDFKRYETLALWDHDLISYVSDINALFEIGSSNQWQWYQPGVSSQSYYTFLWSLSASYPEYWRTAIDCTYTYAPFVENMAPFFSVKLWNYLKPVLKHYQYFSGYGLDCFWIPEALTAYEDLVFPVVIKSIEITHSEPVNPASRRFSNGLSAGEEMDLAKAMTSQLLNTCYGLEDCIDLQCISLNTDDCRERREQFQSHAKAHGLEVDFFDAIDARSWSREQYPLWIAHQGRRVDWHQPLKPGEVGVAASHRALYQQGFAESLTAMVIFEDDAVILKSLEGIGVPEDADLLMLNDRWYHNSKGECIGQSCGAEGYVITRRGMYKMLQILEHMDMPIDLMMIAHCQSMIDSGHGLTQVRNPLNPLLKIYHSTIYCTTNDHGRSTVQ